MTGRGAARQAGAGRKRGRGGVGGNAPSQASTSESQPSASSGITGRGAARQVGAGRKRGPDGVGANRPVASSIWSGTVYELPRGETLEVPMTPKRVRTYAPSQAFTSWASMREPQPSTSSGITSGNKEDAPREEPLDAPPPPPPQRPWRSNAPAGRIEYELRFQRMEDAFFGREEETSDYDEDFTTRDLDDDYEDDEEAQDVVYGPDYFDFLWRTNSEVCFLPEIRREMFEKRLGSLKHYETPYEAFVAIWDRGFMEQIVEQTNLLVQLLTKRMTAQGTLAPDSQITKWTDTDVHELYVWMAIVQAMGVVVKERYEDYWTDNEVFSTPGFNVQMSLQRFQLLNKYIIFCVIESVEFRMLSPSEVKVNKAKPLIDHLNQKFKSMFQMGQNIAIVEPLTRRKRSKGPKEGIKMFEVCDTHTGYHYSFDVQTDVVQTSDGVTVQELGPVESALVLKLLNDLKFQGHTVWMEDYYNSPALARTMKSMGFDCVGTIRTNCQFVPKQLAHLTKSNMRFGDVEGYTSGDVDIIVFRGENRVISLISTYHGDAVKEYGGVLRPIVILDFNINMSGLDKKDKMLAAFPLERKSVCGGASWYRKIFRRLLNVSILNAWILWRHSSTGKRFKEHGLFRMELIESLLQKHCRPMHDSSSFPGDKFPASATTHFPVATEFKRGGKQRLRLKCAVCKKRVMFMCRICEVGLCAGGSFPTCAATYHTSPFSEQ